MSTFKVGDVVLIKYDGTLGTVSRTHSTNNRLHDIKGLRGSIYPNQYACEIEHIEKLKNTELGRAIACTLEWYPSLNPDFIIAAVS